MIFGTNYQKKYTSSRKLKKRTSLQFFIFELPTKYRFSASTDNYDFLDQISRKG